MKTISTAAASVSTSVSASRAPLMMAPASSLAMDGHAWRRVLHTSHGGHSQSDAARSDGERRDGERGLVTTLRQSALELLAQQETARRSPDLRPLDLTQVARETVRSFESGQGSARHPIEFEGTGACRVRGDREHLQALALCLLLDASAYSSPGRAISVSVWCHGEHAHLSILNRGKGELPIENESLFQPFRRLEAPEVAPEVALNAASRAVPDSDESREWWLSLASHIAYTHGGDILIAGTPGLGSEVDVRLPLCCRNGS